jgi:AraC family transcriptional regulator
MDYRHQIQKALSFIEQNLKQRISLDELADVANYSAWHFHRVFYAVTGQTVGEYVRGRRMTEACKELVFTPRSIKTLAFEYQFESQAAFTRAFKSFFGMTPGAMRKLMTPINKCKPLRLIHKTKGDRMLTPRFVKKAAFKAIGISCMSTMQNNVIPQLWGEFNKVCAQIPNITNPGTALGICSSPEGTVVNENTPFKYLACMEVGSFDLVPEGMETREIPEEEYAVFEHHGALDTLDKTYEAIYQGWFSKGEYRHVGNYDFELYDGRFKFGESDSIFEIWIPVKKA